MRKMIIIIIMNSSSAIYLYLKIIIELVFRCVCDNFSSYTMHERKRKTYLVV